MLSNPNVSQIMPNVGNRYESALAIAKRARNIENRRLVEASSDIRDAVDLAAEEIAGKKAFVKIDGKYIVEPPKKDVIEEEPFVNEDEVKE